jgi:intraflagellar transport protein 140
MDIMKAIITFYTKAKAFEQLAGFYESCAQVEIDEYRDYEKALGALKEAQKYLEKASGSHISGMSVMIDERIGLISKFIEARKALKRDPDRMVDACTELLDNPRLEDGVRAGDVLAMLVEYFHSVGRLKEAYKYMNQMTQRNIQLNPYLDARIIEDVHKEMGVSKSAKASNVSSAGASNADRMEIHGKGAASDGEDSVGEEIDEVSAYFPHLCSICVARCVANEFVFISGGG